MPSRDPRIDPRPVYAVEDDRRAIRESVRRLRREMKG